MRPKGLNATSDGFIWCLFNRLDDPSEGHENRKKNAPSKLTGLWNTVDYEVDGAILKYRDKSDVIAYMRQRRAFYFQENTCTIFEADGKFTANHKPYQVSVKDGQQALDLTDNDAKTIPALYAFEGEHLLICWNRNGGPRPNNLRTHKGDGRGLTRLERVGTAK